MPQNVSAQIITQATAVITGSFLSGLMMGLSVVDIPVVLSNATQSSHLLQHFMRLYDIGHKMMPSLAITTCLLYGYTASSTRAAGRSGLPHIIAAVTTISMVPFTWLIMAPTNNALFRMHADPAAADLGEVRRLLVRWAQLHAQSNVSMAVPQSIPPPTASPIEAKDQFFARSKAFWDNYRRGRPQVPPSFFQRIYRYHRENGGRFGTVHDVGAGIGPYAEELRSKFQHVIVSDIVPKNVQLAEEHLGRDGFSYRAAPVEDADDLPPGSVDLVFATNVMHFADQQAAMQAIATQLRPGGTFACAGFGPARFDDPDIQDVWERISQQGGRILLNMADHPQDTVNVMSRSSNQYNVAPLKPRLFRQGALRIRLNMAQGGITGLLPPERQHEVTDPDFSGPTDVVVYETDDDWRFETDFEGFLQHFRSFPHAGINPDAFTGLLQELKDLLSQGKCLHGCWPATLILATRR
ncbi:hypothetical protein CNMCM6069_007944 [Aspergillus lentulus]|nr:hypothetical protein CNMCM6069_007944 [Aspergillus lentulus]